MNNKENPRVRHQITFDVDDGFKDRVRLLSAKWRVKSNVAVQRAVEQALAGKRSDDEQTTSRIILAGIEELKHHLLP